jgi:sugar phosphate permease
MAILFVSSGIGFYGHGVILDPLGVEHGWSKAAVSSAVTLYFLTAGVMGMFVGRKIDRYGSKPVLIAGALIVGVAFFLLSGVRERWQLYAVYFMMAVGWSCTSLVPVTAIIANWFIRKRGMAMSLTMTGLSVGGMVMVPLVNQMILHRGLRPALHMIGLVYGLVVIPTALFFIRQRPAEMGQLPDGATTEEPASRPTASRIHYANQMRVWTRPQAIRTRTFWAIVISFLLALCGQIAFLVHQVSFLSRFLGASGAASAVSITAGASIVGRLFLGGIVDRLDNRHVAIACFLTQTAALLALSLFDQVFVLYLATLAFGLTMGAIIMMQSLIIGECFGLVSFGTVAGLAGLFSLSGAAFGPAIAGVIYDMTQSYQVAFFIFAVAGLLACVTIHFARPPQPEDEKNIKF